MILIGRNELALSDIMLIKLVFVNGSDGILGQTAKKLKMDLANTGCVCTWVVFPGICRQPAVCRHRRKKPAWKGYDLIDEVL